MNITDSDLQEKLTALAFEVTDNFCYSCYQVVKGDRCPKCFSDDFMRHLEGVGVEYGTDWVVEHRQAIARPVSPAMSPLSAKSACQRCASGLRLTFGWSSVDLISLLLTSINALTTNTYKPPFSDFESACLDCGI